jgi:hypothetical protein
VSLTVALVRLRLNPISMRLVHRVPHPDPAAALSMIRISHPLRARSPLPLPFVPVRSTRSTLPVSFSDVTPKLRSVV